MSTNDITDEDALVVDEGIPEAQTDAAGFGPQKEDMFSSAVGIISTPPTIDEDALGAAIAEALRQGGQASPAVQQKVRVGLQTISGYAVTVGAAAGAVVGLAGVVTMPDWLIAVCIAVGAVSERLTGKFRSDQQQVLDKR